MNIPNDNQSAGNLQWYYLSWYYLTTGRPQRAWIEFKFSVGITINQIVWALTNCIVSCGGGGPLPYVCYTDKYHK